jgi:hypothetical protein
MSAQLAASQEGLSSVSKLINIFMQIRLTSQFKVLVI